MAERVLFDMLTNLSSEQLHAFSLHAELDKSAPLLKTGQPKAISTEVIVGLMAKTYGTQCLKLTREILRKMRRADLVHRLSDSSLGTRGKHSPFKQQPFFSQRGGMVMSDIQLLMRTLPWLSKGELLKLKTVLRDMCLQIHYTDIQWGLLHWNSYQEIVFLIVLSCRDNPVGMTKEALKKIERTDLVSWMTNSSSKFKETESASGEHLGLIWKVATIAAIQQLLLEILRCLSEEEFRTFTEFLQTSVSSQDFTGFLNMRRYGDERATTVDLMMHIYGRRCVQLTRGVLIKMRRTDLIEMLTETSLASTEKLSVDEHQPTVKDKTVKAGVAFKLLEMLKNLEGEELDRFKLLLQFEYFLRGIQQIPWVILMHERAAGYVVDLMMRKEQAVEVTVEVLIDMDRTDLVVVSTSKERPKGHGLKNAQFLPVEELHSLDMQKTFTMVPHTARVKLLGIVQELSSGELEQFKHVLLYTKMRKGLPKILRGRVETADKRQTVELMVEIYGQQCVEVTKDALQMINRTDLVEKLSEINAGSDGPSRSLGPEDCEHRTQHSSEWTRLEPGVKSTDGDEFPTYSLQSEAGSRCECSVSGMRWTCKEKVSFQYQFCSWEEHVERIEGLKYLPAGPLMNIKITAGKFDEVYLPHWICLEDDSGLLDKFAVLHIDDCGDVVEQVSEVTPTHVKICDPVFSPKAVLIRAGVRLKMHCSILIYKTNTDYLTLHVYLIPRDPGLQQEMDRRESSYGYNIIRKPPPEKSLRMRDRFILTADVDGAEIVPEEMKLRYEWRPANFFEVFIDKPDGNFTLKLAQKNESAPVWTRTIRKVEYQSTGHTKDRQPEDLSAYFQKAAAITTDKERLLEILEELKQNEFEKFKWFIRDKGVLAGLPQISTGELENKDVLEVVDLMSIWYGQQCMELTKKVLKRIHRNDLLQML